MLNHFYVYFISCWFKWKNYSLHQCIIKKIHLFEKFEPSTSSKLRYHSKTLLSKWILKQSNFILKHLISLFSCEKHFYIILERRNHVKVLPNYENKDINYWLRLSQSLKCQRIKNSLHILYLKICWLYTHVLEKKNKEENTK